MQSMTYSDIKKRLVKHYCGWLNPDEMKRELMVYTPTPGFDDYCMMALRGSPPKGYCIANGSTVSLYDLTGKRYQILIDTYAVPDEEMS